MTAALRTNTASQDDEHRRLQLLTVEMIRRDTLRDNFENGRFAREIDSLDLEIWRRMQDKDATFTKVGREFGISHNDKIREAVKRVDDRIIQDAKAVLESLGLL